MGKVDDILQRFHIESAKYTPLKEESFASEVYLVEVEDEQKILKFAHSEVKFGVSSKDLIS